MLDFLFYLFSALTLLAAFLVVTSRNAVNGAMFMILSFVGLASLFLLLEAFLLAVLQIFVYAGAIIVLFLFIIMLLNVEEAEKHKPAAPVLLAGGLSFVLLAAGVFWLFLPQKNLPAPDLIPAAAFAGGAVPASWPKNFGYLLFTQYLLPFQVTGFLLLAAMIGIHILSRRPPPADKAAPPEMHPAKTT